MKDIITTKTDEKFTIIDKVLIDNNTHYLVKSINDNKIHLIKPQSIKNYEIIR